MKDESPRRVRQSLDLEFEDHVALDRMRAEIAGEFGWSRFTKMELLQVTVRTLLTEPNVARRVKANLRPDS